MYSVTCTCGGRVMLGEEISPNKIKRVICPHCRLMVVSIIPSEFDEVTQMRRELGLENDDGQWWLVKLSGLHRLNDFLTEVPDGTGA